MTSLSAPVDEPGSFELCNQLSDLWRHVLTISKGHNSGAQRQLTRTAACGSAWAAGSTVYCSDLLDVNVTARTRRSLC